MNEGQEIPGSGSRGMKEAVHDLRAGRRFSRMVRAGWLRGIGRAMVRIGFTLAVAGLLTMPQHAAEPAETRPAGALAASSEPFYPVPLAGFYQRLLGSYTAREAWGAVPRGLHKFDGVPFLLEGKIEMNGMGASRDNNFMAARVGEIPVNRRAVRLHLIAGAGYKDPDDTPIAEIRLNYKSGQMRHIVIKYGEHVRNWHVEGDEKRTDLLDPRAHIIWNGINGATGKPLRLFKNTFDNPLPQQEIKSLQVLSMFGKAFFALCAITLEEGGGNAPGQAPGLDEPDDTPYRRESLVRVLDADTGLAISNAVLVLIVTEDDKIYKFGRYQSDRLG
ncbi:MAG: hypothetical protein JWM16_2427 [Verrucomicrobiales bacterium]|nr:hypothetical protein [Verrucomicrobiales bacterium]